MTILLRENAGADTIVTWVSQSSKKQAPGCLPAWCSPPDERAPRPRRAFAEGSEGGADVHTIHPFISPALSDDPARIFPHEAIRPDLRRNLAPVTFRVMKSGS
jgi:hypothetical protein